MVEKYVLNLSKHEFEAVYGTYNMMILSTFDVKGMSPEDKKDYELDYYRLANLLASIPPDSLVSLTKKLDEQRQVYAKNNPVENQESEEPAPTEEPKNE